MAEKAAKEQLSDAPWASWEVEKDNEVKAAAMADAAKKPDVVISEKQIKEESSTETKKVIENQKSASFDAKQEDEVEAPQIVKNLVLNSKLTLKN